MFSATNLAIGLIAGAIGMGYFVYGKKQEKVSFIIAGIALCGYPYLFASLWALCLVGVVLVAYPFVWKYYL